MEEASLIEVVNAFNNTKVELISLCSKIDDLLKYQNEYEEQEKDYEKQRVWIRNSVNFIKNVMMDAQK